MSLMTRLSNVSRLLKTVSARVYRRRMTSQSPSPANQVGKLPRGNSEELGFYYRHPGRISPSDMRFMEGFGAFMWFWVLYHTYHYPHLVFGHPMYPNPRQWSDEELGLPPV